MNNVILNRIYHYIALLFHCNPDITPTPLFLLQDYGKCSERSILPTGSSPLASTALPSVSSSPLGSPLPESSKPEEGDGERGGW